MNFLTKNCHSFFKSFLNFILFNLKNLGLFCQLSASFCNDDGSCCSLCNETLCVKLESDLGSQIGFQIDNENFDHENVAEQTVATFLADDFNQVRSISLDHLQQSYP